MPGGLHDRLCHVFLVTKAMLHIVVANYVHNIQLFNDAKLQFSNSDIN